MIIMQIIFSKLYNVYLSVYRLQSGDQSAPWWGFDEQQRN